jgi:hypothetical protein
MGRWRREIIEDINGKVKKRNYRRYQWEGEGEIIEDINGKVKERNYRRYQWEGEGGKL